jgi:hypothetical protein
MYGMNNIKHTEIVCDTVEWTGSGPDLITDFCQCDNIFTTRENIKFSRMTMYNEVSLVGYLVLFTLLFFYHRGKNTDSRN